MANIVVLFEVKPTKAGMKKYLDLAAMLKPLLDRNFVTDNGSIFFCIDNGVSEAAADTSLNAEAEEQSLSDTLANERMNEGWIVFVSCPILIGIGGKKARRFLLMLLGAELCCSMGVR